MKSIPKSPYLLDIYKPRPQKYQLVTKLPLVPTTEDHHTQFLLSSHRNFLRLAKFYSQTSLFRKVYKSLVKMKFQQDYHQRVAQLGMAIEPLSTQQIQERLNNSLAFVHNACCLQPGNKEHKILQNIIRCWHNYATQVKLNISGTEFKSRSKSGPKILALSPNNERLLYERSLISFNQELGLLL